MVNIIMTIRIFVSLQHVQHVFKAVTSKIVMCISYEIIEHSVHGKQIGRKMTHTPCFTY